MAALFYGTSLETCEIRVEFSIIVPRPLLELQCPLQCPRLVNVEENHTNPFLLNERNWSAVDRCISCGEQSGHKVPSVVAKQL